MIKYIGIILLSSSVCSYGFLMSKKLKQDHNVRNELTNLLRSIEHGIRYGSKPINQILSECNLPYLKKCGFITCLLSGCDIRENTKSHLGMLTDEEKQRVTEFFSLLGRTGNSESELIFCKGYIEYFENFEKISQEQVKSKSLLYRKIGIIFGILAAIIFI